MWACPIGYDGLPGGLTIMPVLIPILLQIEYYTTTKTDIEGIQAVIAAKMVRQMQTQVYRAAAKDSPPAGQIII